MTSTIADLCEALPSGQDIDLINEFAYPLPAIVIAQMLGVPPSDRDLFKNWSDKLTALVYVHDVRPSGGHQLHGQGCSADAAATERPG